MKIENILKQYKLDHFLKKWSFFISERNLLKKDDYFINLLESVSNLYQGTKTVYPAIEDVFNVFKTDPNKVSVVILGQDPYHNGSACGYAFASSSRVVPASLNNMFKSLYLEFNKQESIDTSLEGWIDQGVFLLNTCLTVFAQEANSHKNIGWYQFTKDVITFLNEQQPIVFLLMGNHATKYESLIDQSKHKIIISTHPSPLSANRAYAQAGNKNFFESHVFTAVNNALVDLGKSEIDWFK